MESNSKCLIALINTLDPLMDHQVYFTMMYILKYTWGSMMGSELFVRAMRHLHSDSLKKINTCITCVFKIMNRILMYSTMMYILKYTWGSMIWSKVFVRALRNLLLDSLKKNSINTCIKCVFKIMNRILMFILKNTWGSIMGSRVLVRAM